MLPKTRLARQAGLHTRLQDLAGQECLPQDQALVRQDLLLLAAAPIEEVPVPVSSYLNPASTV